MSQKVRKKDDPKQHWVCEFCGRPHIDKDPPEACEGCGGVMFDNLFDMMMAAGAQTDHHA